MFFKLHKENRIGYKELTDVDLGRKPSSHQTHIGLFDDVLTFLHNSEEVHDCMVIYNQSVELLFLSFDRIKNPDGTYRSPKIRLGGTGVVSVATFIRDKARECNPAVKWYLFWFGLESERPVFFVFNDKSDEFAKVQAMGIRLVSEVKGRRVKGRVEPSDGCFNELLAYLELQVNSSGGQLIQELEVATQVNEQSTNRRYREYDLRKSQEIFSRIGKEGEALVNAYFSRQKKRRLILNYKWVNAEKECGLPYDFFVETLSGNIVYLDVKTTKYQFEQRMVFSSQEIEFALSKPNGYCIYRVYSNENGERELRVCGSVQELFGQILTKTRSYQKDMFDFATVETVKMAISPSQKTLVFDQPIILECDF